MRASFIHGVRDIRAGDRPAADRPGSIRIRVAGVGVCGSDLHYYLEGGIGAARIAEPFIPGHEFAGWVVGDHPARGLRDGQLVAVDPARPCGRCEWCARGHVNLCPDVEFVGAPPHHGAMAETIDVMPEQIYPVPDGFTVEQAVMLEPLGVAIHAIDLAKPRLLETVAVLGCGPIGLCLIQVARLCGVERIFAIDPVAHRAEAAVRLGADGAGPDRAAIADWTGGRGVDRVLEATNSPDGFQHAVDVARIGGRLVLAGIPDGDRYALAASDARRKGLEVKFSRRMGHVYPRAIALVAQRKVDVGAIVTHRFGLDRTAEAFDILAEHRDGALKSMVVPTE